MMCTLACLRKSVLEDARPVFLVEAFLWFLCFMASSHLLKLTFVHASGSRLLLRLCLHEHAFMALNLDVGRDHRLPVSPGVV